MDEEEKGVREELDDMPRPVLTDTAVIWRSYWVQWQDWADRLMRLLRITKPTMTTSANVFAFGRKGTQKMIEINVAMVLAEVDTWKKKAEELDEEILSTRAHDDLMIAALSQGQDKLRAELAASEAARAESRAQWEKWQASSDKCRAELREVEAKLEAAIRNARDEEELDGTDFAHPAWWRGSDQATHAVVHRLQAAIGGDDNGAGTLGDPGLEAVRRWILGKRK